MAKKYDELVSFFFNEHQFNLNTLVDTFRVSKSLTKKQRKWQTLTLYIVLFSVKYIIYS